MPKIKNSKTSEQYNQNKRYVHRHPYANVSATHRYADVRMAQYIHIYTGILMSLHISNNTKDNKWPCHTHTGVYLTYIIHIHTPTYTHMHTCAHTQIHWSVIHKARYRHKEKRGKIADSLKGVRNTKFTATCSREIPHLTARQLERTSKFETTNALTRQKMRKCHL